MVGAEVPLPGGSSVDDNADRSGYIAIGNGINSFPLSGGARGSYFYFFNTCHYILRYPPCGEGAPAAYFHFERFTAQLEMGNFFIKISRCCVV